MEKSYSTLEVLFEDNHLIAVNKPAGLLTQADRAESDCLLERVRGYLKERYQKPGQVFVGLLHRLDRPVSGVVLFAKTSKGASRLSEQFREHTISKRYLALVEGHPAQTEAQLEHYLGSDAQNGVEIQEGPAPHLKKGVLRYRRIAQGPRHSLLEVALGTGRKHQIRAQLSFIGHPIAGDSRYGAKTRLAEGQIGLKSRSLEFQHPVRREERVRVELPGEPSEGWAAWL